MNTLAVQKCVIDWLSFMTKAESPPCSVVAFNIGLFESGGGYQAYLVGADRYDPDDDDWACDEVYTTKDRYLALSGCTGADAWDQVLGAVAEGVREYLESSDGRASFLAEATAVSVGFDDGDLVVVWPAGS